MLLAWNKHRVAQTMFLQVSINSTVQSLQLPNLQAFTASAPEVIKEYYDQKIHFPNHLAVSKQLTCQEKHYFQKAPRETLKHICTLKASFMASKDET